MTNDSKRTAGRLRLRHCFRDSNETLSRHSLPRRSPPRGDDRYFDVFVEYAKSSPDDVLVRIEAIDRGPEAAKLHLLPTLWFRRQYQTAGGNRSTLCYGIFTDALDDGTRGSDFVYVTFTRKFG